MTIDAELVERCIRNMEWLVDDLTDNCKTPDGFRQLRLNHESLQRIKHKLDDIMVDLKQPNIQAAE